MRYPVAPATAVQLTVMVPGLARVAEASADAMLSPAAVTALTTYSYVPAASVPPAPATAPTPVG